MIVRFLMIAEINVEDEDGEDGSPISYDAESAERDATRLLDAYREAAAYTVGTEFGVCLFRASDEEATNFETRDDAFPRRCFVPPLIDGENAPGNESSAVS